MTKQGEIREGLTGMELGTESEGVWRYELSSEDVGKILKNLHSQSVVIKVDRELPSNPFYLEKDKVDENFEEDWEVIETSKHIGFSIGLNLTKEAGYVAVEPLIEEEQ